MIKKSSIQSKRKWIWSIAPIVLLLLCSYFGIYHSHRYYSFDANLWVTMTGVIACLVLQWIWTGYSQRWYRLKAFLFVFCLAGPIGIFVVLMHNRFVYKQMAAGSTVTIGIVQHLFAVKYKNSFTHYALFTYHFHGKIYTQKLINKNKLLVEGDTLVLRCSDRDPEMIERLEEPPRMKYWLVPKQK